MSFTFCLTSLFFWRLITPGKVGSSKGESFGTGLLKQDFLQVGHPYYRPDNCVTVLKGQLHFNSHFSGWILVSWYQNVSILDFIAAKDDGGGGDNWTCQLIQVSAADSASVPLRRTMPAGRLWGSTPSAVSLIIITNKPASNFL